MTGLARGGDCVSLGVVDLSEALSFYRDKRRHDLIRIAGAPYGITVRRLLH